MLGLAKQLQRAERERKDERELRPEYATRTDLDAMRDRVAIIAQQAVSASLSAWHDKMENRSEIPALSMAQSIFFSIPLP